MTDRLDRWPRTRRRQITRVAFAALVGMLAIDASAQPTPASARTRRAADRARTPPKLLSRPDVPYPEGASGHAVVLLTLVVDQEGNVFSAEPAVRSSAHHTRSGSARATWGVDALGRTTDPNAIFRDTAARAARSWKFLPATRGGKTVRAKITIELAFREPTNEPAPKPGAAESTVEPAQKALS